MNAVIEIEARIATDATTAEMIDVIAIEIIESSGNATSSATDAATMMTGVFDVAIPFGTREMIVDDVITENDLLQRNAEVPRLLVQFLLRNASAKHLAGM